MEYKKPKVTNVIEQTSCDMYSSAILHLIVGGIIIGILITVPVY